jgi:hypothetical protein
MNVTMAGVLLVLQLSMALVLCWSCLCRATKTNGDTRREVRWAMVFEGAAAGLLLGAPFLPALMPEFFEWEVGTTPVAIWMILLVSILTVQLVTAKYWQQGVPERFQVGYQRPASSMLAFALAVVAIGIALGTGIGQAEASTSGQRQPDAHAHRNISPGPTEEEVPLGAVREGGTFVCNAPEGCVGMTGRVFGYYLEAAPRCQRPGV